MITCRRRRWLTPPPKLLRSSPPTILRQIIHQFSLQLCVPQVPPAPGFNQVQGQRSEAGDTVDCAGGGQVPGHGVWGPAGAVGPASCAQEDQTGGDDCQHPDTRGQSLTQGCMTHVSSSCHPSYRRGELSCAQLIR